MKETEAQRRAALKYRKAHTKMLSITLYPGDQDIIDWIAGIDGKAAYLRKLIRDDIARRKEEEDEK